MGGSIPNYVCSVCGRGFSSSRSARRHIANVESGNGQVMAEADYRISLQTGTMLPPPSAQTGTRNNKKNVDLGEIAREEFTRGLFRKLGENEATTMKLELRQMMVAQIISRIITQL